MKFSIFCLSLILSVTSIQHEYELSRGRRLWAGMYNAVHYLDHFSILSEKMPGSHGIFSTYFDLAGGDNWTFTFTLEIIGQIQRPGDGFVFGLTSQPPQQNDIQEYKDVPNMLVADKPGLQIKILNDQNKIEVKLEESEAQSCTINPSDNKITFYIKSFKRHFIVSFHQSDSSQFIDCAAFQTEKNYLSNFYPIIYGKSSQNSALRFDLYSMTFATVIENLQITQFEAKFDQYMPKLFKEISFLKKNENFMKNIKKKYFDEKNLNIKNLVRTEDKALQSIEIAQQYIGNCLNEQKTVQGYFQIQQESTQDFGRKIINGIQSWLSNSLSQMKEMDKYAEDLNKDIENLDFGNMMTDTNQVIDKIKQVINDNKNDIDQVLKRSSELFQTLQTLERQSGLDIEKIYNRIYKQQKLKMGEDKLSKNFTMILIVFYAFVLIVLLGILWKITHMKKVEDPF